jgi:uncharacterized damage-inducible protein DinB
MITPDYVRTMAAYNRWQNGNLYGAADGLSDADRKTPRAAFFGSIHATLNHLLWGDQVWMHRFAGFPKPGAPNIPASVAMFESWGDLKRERAAFDQAITDWAERIDPEWLAGDLVWFSGSTGREMRQPRWLLVTHMFNHQTHHRGQVHCMLTQAGAKPGTTDLPFRDA